MGIRNLHKFLGKHAPHVYVPTSLDRYQFRTIAVDVNLYLYRFKASHRNRWLTAFLNMVTLLRKHRIRAIFVYDTKAPAEKYDKQQERKSRKSNVEKQAYDLRMALSEYQQTGECDQILVHASQKRKLKRLLSPQTLAQQIDVSAIEQEIQHLETQVVSVTRADVRTTKDLLDLLSVEYYDSPNEAETLCAHMCVQGKVDAVLSNDTDVLVYGTPVFLSNLHMGNENCTEIRFTEVLQALDITHKQFIDFCIMCGTDYNKNIYNVGPEKAFKMIREVHDIDHLDERYDASILNHVRVREIFGLSPDLPDIGEHAKRSEIDWNRFDEFAFRYNLFVDKSALRDVFQ